MTENKKRVIALGFFDGLHIGHAELIERTKKTAQEKNMIPSVLTFDMHPDMLVQGERVELICSPFERVDLLHRLFGIQDVVCIHFNQEMMQMNWAEFVSNLKDEFDAGYLIAGDDFNFGYEREGNAKRLIQKCDELGIGCEIVPEVSLDGIRISSTYIRTLLLEGKMSSANRFLGHRYTLTDMVRHGYRLGKRMGYPTINMRYEPGVLVPALGVYATKTYIRGEEEAHISVTNVGVRPTVSGGINQVSVETHILNYNQAIYGKWVRLEFYEYLRPEVKFENTDRLKTQLAVDCENAKKYFESLEE